MFKKELTDVVKQTAIFLPAVALIPAVILSLHLMKRTSYLALLLPVFQTALLFWALFLGASLLTRERDQHAVEYALSMPYSRLQLLGLKILPRAAVLGVLYFFFWLLYRASGSSIAAMGIDPFTITLVFLFVIAVCLAPIIENFLVLTLMTMFSAAACWIVVLTIIWMIHSPGYSDPTWTDHFKGVFTLSWLHSDKWLGPLLWADGLIVIVPFILAFLETARKLDVKPVVHHGRRFAAFFIPVALAAAGSSYVLSNSAVPPPEAYYELTQDHTLLEYQYSRCTVYHEDHKVKHPLKDGMEPWTAFEKDNLIYYRDGLGKLKKLDMESGAVTDLPPDENGAWSRFPLRDGRDIYYIKPRNAYTEDIRLIKRTENSAETAEIIFRDVLFQKDSPNLFGTNVFEGKRYWLANLAVPSHPGYERYLLRLWENGRVESSPMAPFILPVYFNHLLFSRDKENITILKDTGTGIETAKTIACDRDSFPFDFFREESGTVSTSPFGNKVCYTSRGQIVRLDLATLETEEVGALKAGMNSWVMNLLAFGSFMVEEDPALKKMTYYRIEGRRLVPLRAFSLTKVKEVVMPQEGESYTKWKEQFDHSDTGIILRKGKKVRVFAWPDLRELKFKGL